MKIAIVEDDINYRKSLETAFEDYKEYEVVSFKNPKEALKKLDDSFELVITDINMPQMDGLSFLQELDGRYEAIVITGNASVQNAIKSIRLGVKDFLIKGFEIETLIEALQRSSKIRQIAHKTNKPSASKTNHKDFIASSPRLEEVKSLALKVATTDASVLLLGQSGVGKDVFANFIHRHSHRAQAPFIAINMAAIPEHLLESELFGYEKGAFTDATSAKPGILEDANGGSVFLDEIGEMPLTLQAKLLRVLQEKSLTRLGSSKPIKIDVRFISATNADIHAKIAKNEFREDLFFRLQT
ncbi:sigma-54 dependent transcriptional regulator, partial [uncultured Helicobacter sp.]